MLGAENWIIAGRCDALTAIFRYFPWLVSDYFYITVIALGYWVKPTQPKYRALAFLIPYTTLLNNLLKNIFQIPRPDSLIHLVPVHDPFGFPSGDMQVATVFWLYIFLTSRRAWFSYLCFIPILGVAYSRIYLGVHSLCDVTFGFCAGAVSVVIWLAYVEKWMWEKSIRYWLVIIIAVLIYGLVSVGLEVPRTVSLAVGMLVGLGVVLKHIKNIHNKTSIQPFHALGYLVGIICLVYMIPTFKSSYFLGHLSTFTKFFFVSVCVFYIVPKFDQVVCKKFRKHV